MAYFTVTFEVAALSSVTVKVNAVVPLLPSFLATLLMEMFELSGGIVSMVAWPWPSAIVALALGLVRLRKKVLFAFDLRVAEHRHGNLHAGDARGKGQRAAGRDVIVVRHRGRAVDGSVPTVTGVVEALLSVTVKINGLVLTGSLPSRATTSLTEIVGSTGAVSSLTMVPTPTLLVNAALELGLERLTLKVSLLSTLVSPIDVM